MANVANLALASPDSEIVMIGCGAYDHEGLPSIPAASRSLALMRNAIAQGARLDGSRIRYIEDPDNVANVGFQIAEASEQARDVLLFYFVGHGLIGNDGDLHLAIRCTDPRLNRLSFGSLPYSRVREALLNSPARCVVVVLDCCFSGRAIHALGGDAYVNLQIDGACVIAASARDQAALIVDGEEITAFSRELAALAWQGGDFAGSTISVRDAFRHLEFTLPAKGFPRPIASFSQTVAEMPLIWNARSVQGPPLSPLSTNLGAEEPVRHDAASAPLEIPAPDRRPAVVIEREASVREKWPEILRTARQENKPVHALLQNVSSVDLLTTNQIRVVLPTDALARQLTLGARVSLLLRAVTLAFPHVPWEVAASSGDSKDSELEWHSLNSFRKASIQGTTSSSDGDIADVRVRWPEVMAEVRAISKPTHALLQNATVSDQIDFDVYVSMPTAPLARQLRMCNRADVVQAALSAVERHNKWHVIVTFDSRRPRGLSTAS